MTFALGLERWSASPISRFESGETCFSRSTSCSRFAITASGDWLSNPRKRQWFISRRLELHRGARVEEAAVEAERREARIRQIILVDRVDAAALRRRTRAERRTIGIDVEHIVGTDREIEMAERPEAKLDIGDPFGAEVDVVGAEQGEAQRVGERRGR